MTGTATGCATATLTGENIDLKTFDRDKAKAQSSDQKAQSEMNQANLGKELDKELKLDVEWPPETFWQLLMKFKS